MTSFYDTLQHFNIMCLCYGAEIERVRMLTPCGTPVKDRK